MPRYSSKSAACWAVRPASCASGISDVRDGRSSSTDPAGKVVSRFWASRSKTSSRCCLKALPQMPVGSGLQIAGYSTMPSPTSRACVCRAQRMPNSSAASLYGEPSRPMRLAETGPFVPTIVAL